MQRQTWALACYLSNTKQEVEWKGNKLNSLQVFGTVENTQCSDLPGNLELDAGESEETVIKILKSNSSICSNNDKADVMPTWAATKSLIMANQGVLPEIMNSGVMAPLLLKSPTDFSTLYTALKFTQDVSAFVYGPDKRTFIMLDMDLFERAMKIKCSMDHSNWFLRPGELHYCFASLHALGKNIEGSGLDSCAIETGIYSPPVLRQLYAGKGYKRAVEYHLTMSLVILDMKFEAVMEKYDVKSYDSLKGKCDSLKKALNERDEYVAKKFEDVKEIFSRNILPELSQNKDAGELAKFLENYLQQVEALLNFIATCRSRDLDGYVAAAENLIKYLFAYDLHHYSRLIPVHVLEMKHLRDNDPESWKDLCDGFSVSTCGIPFCNLFSDQNLEQHIKVLKSSRCLLGLTQSPESVQRLMFTSPHLARILQQFQSKHVPTKKEHYQLTGNVAARLSENTEKLLTNVKMYCTRNPFTNGAPLRNIVSSTVIPDEIKLQILNLNQLGGL